MRRLAGCLLAVIALLVVSAGWWLPTIGHWLALPLHLNRADVIAVHGGNSNRTLYGVALYHQKYALELWHTGYAIRETSVTELVLQGGVPQEKFHYLSTINTWDDAERIVAFAKQHNAHSILVVTEWWHSRRAMCADQYHLDGSGITLYYTSPSDTPYTPDNWWQSEDGRSKVLIELLKFGYYWVRYGMAPWRC